MFTLKHLSKVSSYRTFIILSAPLTGLLFLSILNMQFETSIAILSKKYKYFEALKTLEALS